MRFRLQTLASSAPSGERAEHPCTGVELVAEVTASVRSPPSVRRFASNGEGVRPSDPAGGFSVGLEVEPRQNCRKWYLWLFPGSATASSGRDEAGSGQHGEV